MDKRSSFGGSNISQDYTCVGKPSHKINLDLNFQSYVKDKLKSSRSSGKLSKNLPANKKSYIEKYGSRTDKGFGSNTSSSKGRDKSFQKLKENEFRKLLRPLHTIDSIQKGTSFRQGVNINHLNIKDLIEGPINENELFKSFENQNNVESKPK